jgi:hypothetical protein
VKELSGRLQRPDLHATSADARLRVGAVDPIERAVLAARQQTVLLHLVNANALDARVLLVGNEHNNDADFQLRLLRAQLRDEYDEMGRIVLQNTKKTQQKKYEPRQEGS